VVPRRSVAAIASYFVVMDLEGISAPPIERSADDVHPRSMGAIAVVAWGLLIVLNFFWIAFLGWLALRLFHVL
jgi:hypothetical protein